MFLLAQFREAKALQPLLTFFADNDRSAIALTGDVVTENLGQLLAGVSNGDITPIRQLIENSSVDPFVRAAGLEALLCLVAWGDISPRQTISYFAALLNDKLERRPSQVWNYLAEAISRLCGPDFRAPLKKAYDEGLISPLYMNWDEAEKMLTRPIPENRADLENDAGLQPISNVVAEMSGWACFRPQARRLHGGSAAPPQRITARTGRNDPCPCGSGKKYKKCCLTG